jgi:cell division septum initiation protein DivIVA
MHLTQNKTSGIVAFMEPYHVQAIFNLEQEVLRFQEKEERCQAMVVSSLTSPEVRSQARAELDLTIEKIKSANDELDRLRSEL